MIAYIIVTFQVHLLLFIYTRIEYINSLGLLITNILTLYISYKLDYRVACYTPDV